MLVPYRFTIFTMHHQWLHLMPFKWYWQLTNPKFGELARRSVVAICLTLFALSAQSQPTSVNASLEQQILQLRQILLEQDLRISQQQEEIQEIRGKNEELVYRLEQLKKQQQDIYVDLDERINQLKATQIVAPAPPPSTLETEMMDDEAANAPVTDTSTTETTDELPPDSMESASPEVSKTEASPQEEEIYESAFKLLKVGRYSEAIDGFKSVLQQSSQGEYADNSQYWIAESQYALHHFDEALQEFDKLLQQYPNSPKRAHALLKMGYVHYELRDYEKAREVLSNVVTTYPGSASARLAEQRLQKIQVDGM